MARFLRRKWRPSDTPGLSRRDRQPCDYSAYIPDRLSGRSFLLEGRAAADVGDAESAIRALDTRTDALADTEALARLLLRAESVASSHIEGLQIGGRRLLRAEAAQAMGAPISDVTAEEVLGNIEAMSWATENLANAEIISVQGILKLHERLLVGTHLSEYAGKPRSVQNWIGGSAFNPCSAAFVPPPHDYVERLLEDLCDFCNSDDLPAIAQAAIAHAQFETIHPFVDGNGRAGRALIHVLLRRRGVTRRVSPPISLVLATWSRDYAAGLDGTRYLGSSARPAAVERLNRWVGLFAAACQRAVDDAIALEDRISEIQDGWRRALGKVRANSAAALLIERLPGSPILTVTGAADLIGRSFLQTNEAIRRLEAGGILSQITVGRRNRAFEARAIVDAFTSLERQLGSPNGSTLTSPPTRQVPRRPPRS